MRSRCVAIVGARVASAAGQRFARQLARRSRRRRATSIVSGLARGIDGAAHQGSPWRTGTCSGAGRRRSTTSIRPNTPSLLSPKSPPNAAASSPRTPYGRTGRKAQGFPPPQPDHLRPCRWGWWWSRRRCARAPSSPLGWRGTRAATYSPCRARRSIPARAGTNDLIRQGAQLCEGAEDVIRTLQTLPLIREPQGDLFEASPQDQSALDREADRLRAKVERLLSPTPVPRDELVRALDAPPAAVFAALVELSLAGKAELLPGGLVAKS